MAVPKKIISLTTPSTFHSVESSTIPLFPGVPEDLGPYLHAIGSVIETGIVTKNSQEELKMNKLRLILAFSNLYRLVDAFPLSILRPEIQALSASGMIGIRFLKILDFLTLAKERYAIQPDSVERFYQSENMFHSESYGDPVKAKAIIDSFLEIYPPNGDATDKPRIDKHKTWSGSDASDGNVSFSAGAKELEDAAGLSTLHIEDIEAAYESRNSNLGDSSGSGSENSKESDPSSQGREDFVSLTSATLRRTLKNYWRAKEIGIVVQDEILCSLWDKSIVGKACSAERLEQAIAFFPLELAFLWDRETQVVTAFNIGKSHAIEIRDLTEEEKVRHTVIIHNHPHGDTFSLEDLVLCSNKGAKEVRAVTISCESPDTMELKSYRCEILDIPGFDVEGRMHLLNAVHLYFANGREIENALEPYEIDRSILTFRENEFSVLESVGIARFYGSCDNTYKPSTEEALLEYFQDEEKCSNRGLTAEQRLAALKYFQ